MLIGHHPRIYNLKKNLGSSPNVVITCQNIENISLYFSFPNQVNASVVDCILFSGMVNVQLSRNIPTVLENRPSKTSEVLENVSFSLHFYHNSEVYLTKYARGPRFVVFGCDLDGQFYS